MRHASGHLCLVLLLTPVLANAQERSTLRADLDQQSWLGVKVEGRPFKEPSRLYIPQVFKRLRAFGEVGYRSGENLGGARQIFLEGGMRYKVFDWLRVGMEHRHSFRGPTRKDRDRTTLFAVSRTSLGRFTVDHRLRLQHEYRPRGAERDQIRNRFGIAYDIRKWKLDPEVSVEFFTLAHYQGWAHIGTRYTLGTAWRIAKGHEIDMAVIHDREHGVFAPTHRFIYSVGYTLSLR